jgi:uncharacterized coiled-coil DUF342 family protein
MSDRSNFSPENMRKRFHELGKKRAAILAKTMPLREKRDKILQKAEAEAKALADQFKKIEADEKLFELDQERAVIARALGGKTGKPE